MRRRAGLAPSRAGEHLEAIQRAEDEEVAITGVAIGNAATLGGGWWLFYLFVLFYLAVAAGAVTHADLFLEKPVKLPFFNVELPLLAFFFVAPLLFLSVHAYTLVNLVLLAGKAKRLHHELHDPRRRVTDVYRENRQWRLPNNIFVQFLAGPPEVRDSAFGWLLRAIAWATLVAAPVLLLLLLQLQFLPFHSLFITWNQRLALAADLALVWWLWRKILSGRGQARPRWASWAWPTVALALSAGAVLFSWTIATFPGEPQEAYIAKSSGFEGLAFLYSRLFNSEVDKVTRRRLPFSSTLVLPGFNIYEGLGINDPETAKWRDFIFRARGRDLKGAIFDLASLPTVDFEGADLRGASLDKAQVHGARFVHAQLQGARLVHAQLQGAKLDQAQLQEVSLERAQLQGASLSEAQLQGAWLGGAASGRVAE